MRQTRHTPTWKCLLPYCSHIQARHPSSLPSSREKKDQGERTSIVDAAAPGSGSKGTSSGSKGTGSGSKGAGSGSKGAGTAASPAPSYGGGGMSALLADPQVASLEGTEKALRQAPTKP